MKRQVDIQVDIYDPVREEPRDVPGYAEDVMRSFIPKGENYLKWPVDRPAVTYK